MVRWCSIIVWCCVSLGSYIPISLCVWRGRVPFGTVSFSSGGPWALGQRSASPHTGQLDIIRADGSLSLSPLHLEWFDLFIFSFFYFLIFFFFLNNNFFLPIGKGRKKSRIVPSERLFGFLTFFPLLMSFNRGRRVCRCCDHSNLHNSLAAEQYNGYDRSYLTCLTTRTWTSFPTRKPKKKKMKENTRYKFGFSHTHGHVEIERWKRKRQTHVRVCIVFHLNRNVILLGR